MKKTISSGWRVAIGAVYLLLLASLLYFLKWPWNAALGSLVLFKGLVFLAISAKAGRIDRNARRLSAAAPPVQPPRPQ